jgi:hypothetical protein
MLTPQEQWIKKHTRQCLFFGFIAGVMFTLVALIWTVSFRTLTASGPRTALRLGL